jgi:hypothetical protein
MLRVFANPNRSLPTIGGPAIIGSLLALFLILKLPAVRRPRRSGSLSLPSLRAALLGHGKQQVAAMLGLPRAVAEGPFAIWYYPLHSADRLAMAVSFDHDRVASVEFFHAPVQEKRSSART